MSNDVINGLSFVESASINHFESTLTLPKVEFISGPAVEVGTRPIVVGVCGYKGHGKDTSAEILVKDYGFKKVSFADGVKKVVAEILHIPYWQLHDPARKETLHEPSGKTYRQWMQLMGTEVGRNIWGDAWVNWWTQEILKNGYERVVCADLRFWNEFNTITNGTWDSMTVRVVNPRKLVSEDTHESERYAMQFPVNVELINGGTVAELQESMESKVLRRWPELW